MTDDDVRAALRGAGLPPAAVAGVVGMTAGTRAHSPEQPRDVLTTTPTTLEAWAYAHRGSPRPTMLGRA